MSPCVLNDLQNVKPARVSTRRPTSFNFELPLAAASSGRVAGSSSRNPGTESDLRSAAARFDAAGSGCTAGSGSVEYETGALSSDKSFMASRTCISPAALEESAKARVKEAKQSLLITRGTPLDATAIASIAAGVKSGLVAPETDRRCSM